MMGSVSANAATLARFKTPEACRYGDRCRHKLSCSRFHGTDTTYHAINCACEDDRCPLGHPLRANRGAPGPSGKFQGGTITGKRPGEHYVCNKCGLRNDHYLNECPEATCHKCGGKGHIASNCPNTQGQFNGGPQQQSADQPTGEPAQRWDGAQQPAPQTAAHRQQGAASLPLQWRPARQTALQLLLEMNHQMLLAHGSTQRLAIPRVILASIQCRCGTGGR